MLPASQGEDRKKLLRDMMNLARKKLLCSNDIDSPPYKHSVTARIAILDVLITIDYEPRRESTHQFEMELIASHMRTAFPLRIIACMYALDTHPSHSLRRRRTVSYTTISRFARVSA